MKHTQRRDGHQPPTLCSEQEPERETTVFVALSELYSAEVESIRSTSYFFSSVHTHAVMKWTQTKINSSSAPLVNCFRNSYYTFQNFHRDEFYCSKSAVVLLRNKEWLIYCWLSVSGHLSTWWEQETQKFCSWPKRRRKEERRPGRQWRNQNVWFLTQLRQRNPQPMPHFHFTPQAIFWNISPLSLCLHLPHNPLCS